MAEWVGWGATGLFALSYFFKEASALRRVQALAATAWIAYGLLIKAPPVVASNVVVATLALASSSRRLGPRRRRAT